MRTLQDRISYHRQRAAEEVQRQARAADLASAIAHARLAALHDERANALEQQSSEPRAEPPLASPAPTRQF